MNRLEDAMIVILRQTTAITAIVQADKITHRKARPNTVAPYVVFHKFGTTRYPTLGGALPLRKTRLQFDIYARPDQATDLREIIRDSLVVQVNQTVKDVLAMRFEDTGEEDIDEDEFSREDTDTPRNLLDLFVFWELAS